MKLHEHQGKDLLRAAGVPVLRGKVAFSVDEAVAAALELGSPVTVVKAQIHAGGRGKAGGVKLARSLDEVKTHAAAILGKTLVTPQTGPEGKVVKRLLIEEGCDIARELYVAALVDRESRRVVVMACAEGGVEIEEVAAKHPERILKEHVDPGVGWEAWRGRRLAFGLGLDGKTAQRAATFFGQLYEAFVKVDASLLEINPCVVTKAGDVIALDAKMILDDNAEFRHKDRAALLDPSEENPAELEARKFSLNYIHLGGNIACMVNGAGLAMATMDIVKLHGGEPANFLDVGGGASQEQVTAAFRLLVADPRVRAIFINIFGGILKCDVLSNGVVAAAREVGIKVPVVVRMEGTNVDAGRRILEESGLKIEFASTMRTGAERAVALAGGAK